MSTTFSYLWIHRERPPALSRRWLKVWIKRALSLGALLQILFRGWWAATRGGQIGSLVILERCTFEGDLRQLSLGDETFVGAGTSFALHDRIEVGRSVVINRGVTILTASHSLRDPLWRMYHRPIVIGDHAWIATGAMLLPGVRIGRGAVVGAGAVVRSSVPPYALAIGNPAQIIENARIGTLSYRTAHFPAPFEAWLGKAPAAATPLADAE